MNRLRLSALAGIAALAFGLAGADEPLPPKILIPVPDAERGRDLFSGKGCVICHSVNGVGGKVGGALDTPEYDGEIDPLDFASRMWRGAEAMITLQSLELGYQIQLTGDEIADLAAFVSSDEVRSAFTEKDVAEIMRGWTIDVPFDALGEGPLVEDLQGRSDGAKAEGAGSIVRGYALAERWCTNCHVVAPGSDGGVAGPPFQSIAGKPEMTEDAIRAWLSVPHAEMPEFMNLVDADFADLAAYIVSLRP